jgi:di/tricarboxylate transporter
MAVLSGASFAFMSPVAHQGNTMIMGPGHYRYRDFLRVGTPLTLLAIAVAAVTIPLFWPASF